MELSVLKHHLKQVPRMEPQDAVKLAFQSAFGCGHLLPSKERCVEMIRRELAQTEVCDVPVYTPIGNGLCRLNLASAQVRQLNPEWIWRMMDVSDRHVRLRTDNRARFDALLRQFDLLAARGETAFSVQELRAYLAGYDHEVVSHTETYRRLYHPAYRVVLEGCALLTDVLLHLQRGCRLVVFDGPCGSGKTTLAGLLGELCDAAPIPMDDFFLLPEMRTPERLSEPGGNVHRERFLQEVLMSLPGEVHWQRFDCCTGRMIPRSVPASEIAVIEGSYSHHPAFAERLRELGALRVFVEVDAAEQLRRIEKRDPELVSMFQSRWIPLEKTYFEAYDIRGGVDVVIHSPTSALGEERQR